MFWAEYAGGDVVKGFMVGKVTDGDCLQFSYQHLNRSGEVRTGECESSPEELPDGRLRLHERWRWTNGGGESGHSIVEEIQSYG